MIHDRPAGVDGFDALPASPALPSIQRIRELHSAARQRPGAPVEMLDCEYAVFTARVSQHRNQSFPPPGVDKAVDVLFADASALFTRWAEIPADQMATAVLNMQHPPRAEPTPEADAQWWVAALEARGLRFDLAGKSFQVTPGSALAPSDRNALTELKAVVLAILRDRADVWSPG